jgi:hypothetical protein
MKKSYLPLFILPAFLLIAGCIENNSTNIIIRSIEESQDAYAFKYEAGNWDHPDYTAGFVSPGNHRFLVKTESETDGFIRSKIACRRSDIKPGERDVVVVDAFSGEELSVSQVLESDREVLDVVFKGKAGSDSYFIYYLPHKCSGGYYPQYEYIDRDKSGTDNWLSSLGLTKDKIDNLPLTKTISEQSIDEFHSFFPMDIIATENEVQSFIADNPAPYFLFPEYRHFPISMSNHLPFRWMGKSTNGLQDQAFRGEYYTFQVGLYAPATDLSNIEIEYSGLKGKKGKISAEKFTCFNKGGTDLNGKPLTKHLEIEAGKVQPLWFGIDIAESKRSGIYKGWVRIVPDGMPADTVFLSLEVSDELAVDHGDNSPENMSRLRWLNSTVGVDNDYIIDPFVPVEFSNKKMSVLGREIILNEFGFPEEISSFFAQEMTMLMDKPEPILNSAISMDILDMEDHRSEWTGSSFNIVKESRGVLNWETHNSSESYDMEVMGSLEYDGMLDYKIRLIAKDDRDIKDIKLNIPLEQEVSEYILGLGYTGRTLPDEVQWKWDVKRHQEGAWLGTINKGLQYVLRDENYERPLNTNFYQDKPLNLPPSWYNEGRGGINISSSDGVTLVENYSGSRSVKKGDILNFNIRFLITPFKTIDTKKHFNTRFVHKYLPVDSVADLHGTIVNIHHANEINPYINYPFYNVEEQKAYIDEAHKKGIKVKLYNTIRELTYRSYELFALRSLGDEVLNSGKGGGHSWLQEHLRSDYYSAWHATRVNDAAILNKGNSRWTNYYIEGINWLAKNQGMDGLYLDDIAFSRSTVKRIANVLSKHRGDYVIDLHSANQYNERDGFINSAFLYMEHFPYVSRLWFGEYFDYYADPDYWFTEVSGLPFGLCGEMLQDGGRPYHGLIYGMTTRVYGNYNPSEIWRVFDEFGIADSEMLGYWVDRSPIKTSAKDIKSTVYVKEDKVMIVLASWSDSDKMVSLNIDWKTLGLSMERMELVSPEMLGLQKLERFEADQELIVAKNSGLVLILKSK